MFNLAMHMGAQDRSWLQMEGARQEVNKERAKREAAEAALQLLQPSGAEAPAPAAKQLGPHPDNQPTQAPSLDIADPAIMHLLPADLLSAIGP